MQDWLCQTEFTEPHHPQQNPAKLLAAKWLKQNSRILHQRTGAPENTWLYACQYMVGIHNITSDETLDWITPWQKRHMNTPDISAYLQFHFYERIYYLDPDDKFPSTKYKPARWLGVAHNVGDAMTFCLLSEDMEQVIECSAVAHTQDITDKTVRWDPNLDCLSHDDENDLTSSRQRIDSTSTIRQ